MLKNIDVGEGVNFPFPPLPPPFMNLLRCFLIECLPVNFSSEGVRGGSGGPDPIGSRYVSRELCCGCVGSNTSCVLLSLRLCLDDREPCFDDDRSLCLLSCGSSGSGRFSAAGLRRNDRLFFLCGTGGGVFRGNESDSDVPINKYRSISFFCPSIVSW